MTQIPENKTLPIEINVQEVKQLIDAPANAGTEMKDDAEANVDVETKVLLVDCREASEHEFCRIEGALFIPMNETPNRLAEFESDPESRIIVYCHHGGRSYQVVQYLRSQGIVQAQNMTGGIDAWSLAIDPSIPRY